MKSLYVVRHGKSAWDDPHLTDFDRPLAPRGRKAAPRIAEYMREHGYVPDLVLCSAACRARQTWERMAPVLMTALTSGIALVPLALSPDTPGREILYPVATVIISGLISSTLLDFLVRPALFWTFARNDVGRLIWNARRTNGELLTDEPGALT